MRLLIDTDACPGYHRALAKLLKKYPQIEVDLARAFELIAENVEVACHARPIVGGMGRIFKYRVGSTDMRRGQSGGFRLIALVNDEAVYPLLVYTHAEFENQPAHEMLKNLIAELSAHRTRGAGA